MICYRDITYKLLCTIELYIYIVIDVKREQRSPQFGLLGDYGDYLGFNDNSRLGHRRPLHKHHYRPLGTHGCRGYHCGGGYISFFFSLINYNCT